MNTRRFAAAAAWERIRTCRKCERAWVYGLPPSAAELATPYRSGSPILAFIKSCPGDARNGVRVHPGYRGSARIPEGSDRSCPLAWCRSRRATTITGLGRDDQAAKVGRLTRGSSPIGAMPSRVM